MILMVCKSNYHMIMTTGKIPEDWKHANVCPVFKKGNKHNAINYRPISLTCILCKIMEHIIASSMMDHLENNNILYDLRHGFRTSRSFCIHKEQNRTQNCSLGNARCYMNFFWLYTINNDCVGCETIFYPLQGVVFNAIVVKLGK
jgi:hypothetical protein